MRLRLEIRLGNDAMASPLDCADALSKVVRSLHSGGQGAPIRDANGNTVGWWEVAEARAIPDEADPPDLRRLYQQTITSYSVPYFVLQDAAAIGAEVERTSCAKVAEDHGDDAAAFAIRERGAP